MRASVTTVPIGHAGDMGKVEEHLNKVIEQIEEDEGKVKGVSHYPMQGSL